MRRIEWWIAGVLLLGLVGCAGTKPCLVIPAQVELALDTRDAAREAREKKVREMERWQNAIRQSQARLDRLKEDRDRLQKEVDVGDGQEGDSGTEEKK